MKRCSLARFLCLLVLCTSSASILFAEEYDCARPTRNISPEFVIRRLAEGLEYTDDGKVVPSPGKTMVLTSASRAALRHYIVNNRPRITYRLIQECKPCSNTGWVRKWEYDPKIFGDLGREGPPRECTACGGRVGPLVTDLDLEVVWSGPLPPLEESPKLKDYKAKLLSAREGSAPAQLFVGLAMSEGRFGSRDVEAAREWLTAAAAQRELAALEPLARLYLDPASPFHDHAYGLALSAVAFPGSVQADGDGFVRFKDVANGSDSPEAGLTLQLQVLEAGLLAPVIGSGLKDKKVAAKVLSPGGARRAFAAKPALASESGLDARAAYVRGLARYFGHGFQAPDREEGLRLLELAASKRDVDALALLGMHFDAGRVYPASSSTAWAFYEVAVRAGCSEPFPKRRLRAFAETDVVSDWEGALEVLLERFQAGVIPATMFRQLGDLSIYRSLRPLGAASASSGPFDTAATQDSPLPRAQVFGLVRSLLSQKVRIIELASEDVSVVRKCWDDGAVRFYSVSGIMTFSNSGSRRETAPYTLCFKVVDPSSPPEFICLDAGSYRMGDFPAQCGRRP